MIKLKDLLKEVGEANLAPYKFDIENEIPNKATYYKFKTDSGLDYTAIINQFSLNDNTLRLNITFKPIGLDQDVETNKNEQYRIMATIVNILKQHLSKTPNVSEIAFSPSKYNEGDERRANMYKKYISKLLPGSNIRIYGDKFVIELPNK